jgi:hypothetical protein
MRYAIILLSILCCAAEPIEATRPLVGTVIERPTTSRHPRIEMSPFVIFDGKTWQRTWIIDKHRNFNQCVWYNRWSGTVVTSQYQADPPTYNPLIAY